MAALFPDGHGAHKCRWWCGNWGSLRTPLNLVVIDQLASPMLTCRGAISACMSLPWGWEIGKGVPCSDVPNAAALVHHAIRHETIAVGTCLCLLGGGRTTDVKGSGWVIAPCRMSYRPLNFIPAMAYSTCWRPLVPRCSASSNSHSTSCHRKLTWHNWCCPQKTKQEEDQVACMWQWQGQSQAEQKGRPGWVVSGIHPTPVPVNPLLHKDSGPVKSGLLWDGSLWLLCFIILSFRCLT